MPPKRKGALYKDAMNYYKAAYRAYLKENKPSWRTGDISGTLAWMWLHAPEAEKQVSRDLLADKAQTLPEPNPESVPDGPKSKDDPAPDPAPARVEEPGAEEEDGISDDEDAEPPVKKARINTTAFSYWPDPATIFPVTLPGDEESDNEENSAEKKLEWKTSKQKWLAARLLHPDKEREENRWRGVHFLGEGSAARVGLWIQVNSTNTIEERLAVRDVAVQPANWVNPINWRDQLPREIAIQRRLHERNGHEHHVHRYYGHRISFWQRKYRVYNEVCGLGCLMDALDWYSQQWRRRRNHFKWIEIHPDLHDALDKRRTGQGTGAAVARERKRAWGRLMGDSGSPPPDEIRFDEEEDHIVHVPAVAGDTELDPNFDDFKDMSDIEDWHDSDLPNALPGVIPEAFLWTVFDQLLDAFIVFGKGSDDAAEGVEMDRPEIVHKDVHLQNIFVKKHEGAEGEPLPSAKKETGHRFVRFDVEDFPSVVLADFDQSFFDLKSSEGSYTDNPTHYMWHESPLRLSLNGGGRYPPELYWDFEGHQSPGNFERLTAKTDVWGVGQVMWNLVMNLPGKNGYLQQPFLDTEGTSGRELVNGKPYTKKELNGLFSGRTPFEASRRYSKELKDTIKKCLRYRQNKRETVRELKEVTAKYAYGKRIPSGSNADGPVVVKVPGEMEQFDVGKVYGVAAGGKKRSRE